MHISFTTSRLSGFKNWSDAHPQSSNDDDRSPSSTSIAAAVPRVDETEVTPERLLNPWLVPGVGVSL